MTRAIIWLNTGHNSLIICACVTAPMFIIAMTLAITQGSI